MATRTARQTINTALQRIGILNEEEAANAAQAVQGLAALNDLMQGFPSQGIQYVHATLTIDTVLNVPDDQTRNVMLMLAEELADPYGKKLSENLQRQIVGARLALQAAFYEVPPAQLDDALLNPTLHGTVSIQRM